MLTEEWFDVGLFVVIGVVETPLGFVFDVAGDDSDAVPIALAPLARGRGLEVSVVAGPWRDGARARRRVRARRAPAPGHRDHRVAGAALGLLRSRQDGLLAWTSTGRATLDLLRALVADEARALGYGVDEVVTPPPPATSPGWLLDEAHDDARLAVPCAAERAAREVERATLLATRLARPLGLGDPRVRARRGLSHEVELRADDGLGRSWAIARLRHEQGVLRGSLLAPMRALALALEHLDGALPAWLAPEQVRVLPVGGDPAAGRDLAAALARAGARVGVDAEGPLAGRVGAAAGARVPYLAFVGPREAADRAVRVRARGGSASTLTSWSALVDHVTDDRLLRRPAPVLPSSPDGAAEGGGASFQERVKKERLPSANR